MAIREQLVCAGIKWVDLTDPSLSEIEALSKEYGLSSHTVKDCLEPEHLPKYEFHDGVHFLILRFYAHDFDKRLTTIQEITNKLAIFYTEKFIITVHKQEIAFLELLRKKYVSLNKFTSTTNLLTSISWHALETFDNPVNRLSEQVDFYENQLMLKRTSSDHMEALYYVKVQASISQKILMLMLEPINHLRVQKGEEAALQDVQDQHLKMQTLYNQVLDDVNNLTNLYLSFSAQRSNEVMRVLTIFSVFFMPLTFIVGIYGMNFRYMPELDQRWGYPAVIILMATITLSIFLWFRHKRWL